MNSDYFDVGDFEALSEEECARYFSEESRGESLLEKLEEVAGESMVEEKLHGESFYEEDSFEHGEYCDEEEETEAAVESPDDEIARLEASLKAMHANFYATTTLDLDPSSYPTTFDAGSLSLLSDNEEGEEYLKSFVHLPALRSPRRVKNREHHEFDSPYLRRGTLEQNYIKALAAFRIYY